MKDSSTNNQTSALHEASDEELACRVQSGCANCYNELARRLQPRLLFVLQRRVRHHDDAEDITQKALLRAFEKIHLYDPAHKFCTWLFTIAIRLAAEHYRKRKIPTDSTDQTATTVVDPNPNPEQLAIEREDSQDLWAMADRVLNKNQWTALWLLYGEGQTVSEIAQTLGRTAVSVRVLLYRARKTLTPHLAKFTEIVDHETSDFVAPASPLYARAES